MRTAGFCGDSEMCRLQDHKLKKAEQVALDVATKAPGSLGNLAACNVDCLWSAASTRTIMRLRQHS